MTTQNSDKQNTVAEAPVKGVGTGELVSPPFWPCPNNCMSWCRDDVRFVGGKPQPSTNHHPRCEYVDASLIDVWRVGHEDGGHYFDDIEPDPNELGDGVKVSPEKMHREIYENLPEFGGF